MLNGIQNFLKFINDNWTSIIIIISLIIAIVQKAKNFLTKSTQEKIDHAKAQITQVVLKLITDAETDYSDWEKAGSIKRAQVIQKIFADYPVLSKVANQQEIIDFIDEAINNSLKELRKIISENNKTTDDTAMVTDGAGYTIKQGYISVTDGSATPVGTSTTTVTDGAGYTIKMKEDTNG